MPRVSGIYSRPTGIDAVANNTIDSGKYNSNVADVEADLNLPRPVIAGGTGATNAADALTNLGAVAKAGDTMTGNLTISKANPLLILNKLASGQENVIKGSLNSAPRWQVQLGNSAAESGGNAGSNFSIDRYSDVGVLVDSPLTITRATGSTVFSTTVNIGGRVISGATGGIAAPYGGKHQLIFDAAGGSGADVVGTTTGVAGSLVGFSNNITVALGAINITGAAPGTGVLYTTVSDGNLKEDLRDVTTSGAIIDALKVYDFKWKSTGERSLGVIAQEAQDVLPGAVSKTKAVDGTDIWGVDYGRFVPPLLEEVKRLRKRVADLEAVIGTAGTILARLDVLDKFREKIEAL